MAKAQKLHQYVLKLNTTFLAKHKWNLILPLNEARKTPGCVVSLSDSQVLTWINELNGTEDKDKRAKEITKEIKFLKKQPNSVENKKAISAKYDELYRLQFIEDYMCLIIDKNSDYDRANKGFFINGIKYRRFLATTGGVKMSTIVYVSERLYPELKRRLDNGRDLKNPKNREEDIKLVAAKLEAYQALICSGSIPVTQPRILVVNDCNVTFKENVIKISDECDGEPQLTYETDYEIDYCENDGYGLMSPDYSHVINRDLYG